MRLRAFLFFLVLFSLSWPASAARFTGEYLLQMCASDKDGKELVPGGHVACQAYIAGIMDYHNIIKSMGAAPSVDFCVPENESLYKIQRHVVGYIFKHRSEHGEFIAAPGVALALYTAYPCK